MIGMRIAGGSLAVATLAGATASTPPDEPAAATTPMPTTASQPPTAFIICHLLSDPEARYHDLGADFYDNRIGPERKNRTHVRQPEALGYKVTLEPAA
jgi:hypothetical protein